MDAWIPVACSLEGDDARRRSQQWQALVGHPLEVERSDRQLTIRFAANDIVRTELTRLVIAERQCCAFVDWEFEDLGGEMVLTVSGDPIGVAAMAQAFRLEN